MKFRMFSILAVVVVLLALMVPMASAQVSVPAECGAAFQYGYRVYGAPDGSWTHLGNTLTISKINFYEFNWTSTQPLGRVYVTNDWNHGVYDFPDGATSGQYLFSVYGGPAQSVAFCWNSSTPPPPPPPPAPSQWCGPGYWRQARHLDSWAAGKLDWLLYNALVDPDLPGNPNLWTVLQSPQTYGGAAMNKVADILSEAHPDINFTGERVDSCPLN